MYLQEIFYKLKKTSFAKVKVEYKWFLFSKAIRMNNNKTWKDHFDIECCNQKQGTYWSSGLKQQNPRPCSGLGKRLISVET